MRTRIFLLCMLLSAITVNVWSQDVPLTWGHRWGVGARAVGMGEAYTAISDDYSSLYYNPAGLGQLDRLEVFGAFSHLMMTDKAAYNGEETTQESGFTGINAIGVSVPIPTTQGSFVISFGYHRFRDYDKELLVSSFINLPGQMVTKEYNQIDEGGLSSYSCGASIEASPGVFFGGALNFLSGNNDYVWQFSEMDSQDLYTFSRYDSTTFINTSLSGINITLGALLNIGNMFRFGCAVETPLTLTAKEDWSYQEATDWDTGVRNADTTSSGFSEYKIRSPWVFRIGSALTAGPIILSVDVEFIDFSKIKYKTDPPVALYSMAEANLRIKKNFTNRINPRFGAELQIPGTGACVRAGYGFYRSHLVDGLTRKVISVGGGYNFSNQVILNVAYVWTSWNAVTDVIIQSDEINAKKILATVSYRM